MREAYVAPLVVVPLLMLTGYNIYSNNAEITALKQRISELEFHQNTTLLLPDDDGNVNKLLSHTDFFP